MDIEKKYMRQVVLDLMNIDGKTKDMINAYLDLENLNIRKDLHLRKEGTKFVKPHAAYIFTTSEKITFCKFLKSVNS